MQVIEFFQKNPGAIEQLRGPIFEDKVVDHILSLATVDEKIVGPEELTMPPASEAALSTSAPEAANVAAPEAAAAAAPEAPAEAPAATGEAA